MLNDLDMVFENVKRAKWSSISPLCSFCQNDADTETIKMWIALEKWCAYFFHIKI